jgi:hypothetical protein
MQVPLLAYNSHNLDRNYSLGYSVGYNLPIWKGNANLRIESYFIDMARASIALKNVKMGCAAFVCKSELLRERKRNAGNDQS